MKFLIGLAVGAIGGGIIGALYEKNKLSAGMTATITAAVNNALKVASLSPVASPAASAAAAAVPPTSPAFGGFGYPHYAAYRQ